MTKIFISQPMKDKTDEEIKSERKLIVNKCIEEYGDIEIIDSFFEGAPHDAKPLWFLGKSFQKLAEADVAVFAHGWNDARGCKMEHEACCQYGITIMYADEMYVKSM